MFPYSGIHSFVKILLPSDKRLQHAYIYDAILIYLHSEANFSKDTIYKSYFLFQPLMTRSLVVHRCHPTRSPTSWTSSDLAVSCAEVVSSVPIMLCQLLIAIQRKYRGLLI